MSQRDLSYRDVRTRNDHVGCVNTEVIEVTGNPLQWDLRDRRALVGYPLSSSRKHKCRYIR